MDEHGVPVLDAWVTETGRQTVVWCDWCVAWHRHGAGADGHYVEHCLVPGGPYESTGYVLKVRGVWSRDVRARHEVTRASRRRVLEERRAA